MGSWAEAVVLDGERVCLEPLRVEHADELAPVLNDPLLHTFIGGEPADRHQLRARYRRQVVGLAPDGSQRWLNWPVRSRKDARPVGTVQATVSESRDGLTAEVAWVIGTAHQGHGYAREEASEAVARAVGLTPTEAFDDGEVRWEALVRHPRCSD